MLLYVQADCIDCILCRDCRECIDCRDCIDCIDWHKPSFLEVWKIWLSYFVTTWKQKMLAHLKSTGSWRAVVVLDLDRGLEARRPLSESASETTETTQICTDCSSGHWALCNAAPTGRRSLGAAQSLSGSPWRRRHTILLLRVSSKNNLAE